MSSAHPTVLVILDGYGYSPEKKYNAIANAHKPHIDAWFAQYPHTLLQASGPAVGLLPNTIGTSEVGHLTIGAGRIIPESVLRLQQMIDDGSFFKIPTLVDSLKKIKKSGGTLHLMGLLSDAGVHSHENILYALIKAATDHGINAIVIHPFLDGRDVPPRSAITYLERLEKILKQYGRGTIGTIHGRFYAMDRDKNWQRTEESYKILTQPQHKVYPDYKQHIQNEYVHGIYDEFIPPFQVNNESTVKDGDGIIFFNFRADRARQITYCFTHPELVPFKPKKIKLQFFIGATDYDHDVHNDCLITKEPIRNTFKDVLASAHKTMFSIAETEKYAHVTYFFGGGREQEQPGEQWVLIPSIKTRDYVHYPEMSASKITDAVLNSLTTKPCDFYLINYANADMVGHSGDYDATVKAVECLDRELEKLYNVVVEKMNGTLYITADHGNAEKMYDETSGQPKTSHTLNPVPFIMIKKGIDTKMKLSLKGLSDIAPFILKNMDLPVPKEMLKK
jgi:2,3-bisphosphoglycerate-independent phosphoglycerate mutase